MKLTAYTSIFIVLGWTGLAIAQLWFQPISMELFVKLTITAALGLAAAFVAGVIFREYGNDKVMKDQKFID